MQRAIPLGKRGNHHAVPCREDFLVAPGLDAFLARLEKLLLDRRDRDGHLFERRFELLREVCKVDRAMEDIAALKVALVADVEVALRDRSKLVAENRVDFIGGPDEKFSFLAFAIGVLCRIETVLRTGHLAQNIIDRKSTRLNSSHVRIS